MDFIATWYISCMIFISNSNKKAIFAVAALLISVLYTFYITVNVVSAEVIFTEIMYNPEGTDSGREWVEVYNSGPNSVDLSQYKLLENGTNHKISSINEGDSTQLSAEKYAIIADNPAKFKVDFSISSLILDSAFSLKNDGEQIELVDSTGTSIDSISYLPEWGANGTGNSLQLNDSVWIPAEPTPGLVNKTTAADEQNDVSSDGDTDSGSDSSSSSSNSTHSAQVDLSDYKPKNDLKISIGRNRRISINTPIDFILRHNKEGVEEFNDSDLHVSWSFGDGNSGRKTKADNVFYNPGEYNIIATAFDSNTSNQAVSRTKVYVVEPVLIINLHNRGKTVDIMLKNDNNEEINVGGFVIKSAESSFKIPKDTIISAKKHIIFSNITTGIETFENLSLYYPNRMLAAKLDIEPAYLKLLEVVPEENLHKIVEFINKSTS